MNSEIDKEVDEAVRRVLEKYNPNGFDLALYADFYTEITMSMKDKSGIQNRYGYAYSVARNLIKAVLANKLMTAIKTIK